MSSSLSCTLNAYARYNNGWDNGWRTEINHGMPGFGKDYYGYHRAIVLKITTGSFSAATSKKLQIKIPTCRSTSAGAGTDTWNYGVTPETPDFSSSGQAEPAIPSVYMCSGTWSVYSPAQGAYQYQTLTTVEGNFEPNTTYYIWLWAETPYSYHSSAYIGYFSHDGSYGGLITVTMLYEEGCVKVYNGSEWVDAIPYVHNGTTWVRAIPYVYNGTAWKIGG